MTKTRWMAGFAVLALIAAPHAVWCGQAAGAEARVEVARAHMMPTQVQWEPQGDYERLVLTVSTPGGTVVRHEFAAGEKPVFDLAAEAAADGSYVWELRATPRLDRATKQALAATRETGDAATVGRASAGRPSAGLVQSGTFQVLQGLIVMPDRREERTDGAPRVRASAAKAPTNITAADQVIADDLIVQGSACIGLDCVNNESFGFDTIRLKENNTRIKFDDTSTGTGFPNHDWQLTANDSASGGANKFSIEDITAATVPVTVTGSAPTNSVFVDSTGRVGFRTSTPVLDLHVNTSNTPAMRLEQNNSGGFTAQTWDIAGNEANFFVRDVTGGSRLPLRIRPGAPTSSIDINASGNVGIGTASPSVKLHVSGSDGATEAMVEETSGTAATRTLLEVKNNGASRINFNDTSTGATFGINNIGGNITMVKSGTGGTVAFSLTGAGALTIPSTMTAQSYVTSSDREIKKDIMPVHGEEVLARLATLPISTWTFKTDDVPHLGPMAQDFVAAFGLGPDDKHISLTDMAGVSLAAIQALHRQVKEKDARVAELARQNAELAKRLAELEATVARLAAPK